MKNKLFIISLIIIILALICYIFFTNNAKAETITYDQFGKNAKGITDAILEKYEGKILNPIYIAYPADTEQYPNNPQYKWSTDAFTMLDDNISKPQKISLLIEDKNIYSTVDFIYSPETKGKNFINMNRIDNNYEYVKELGVNLPYVCLVSFTIDGMIIEITTITSEPSNEDGTMIVDTATHSNQLALFIQNYIVENGL